MNKPFLKWAGGKQRLLRNILPQLSSGKRFIEPFVGSGAIFLNTDYPQYLLADTNTDLIQLYLYLQKEGQKFINYCRQFFIPENNQASAYSQLRELFNSTTDDRLKSALFVYLNRHVYNGLCRYNSKGKFNAPFGRYRNPQLPEQAMLNFHHKVKDINDIGFLNVDFVKTMQKARCGDIVYCDPPYVPLSATADFTCYSTAKFGELDHTELAQQAKRLAKKGVPVVISNHDTPFTREIYQSAVISSYSAARHISCQADNRNEVQELLAVFLPE